MFIITARKDMEHPKIALCPPCMLLNGDEYTDDTTNSYTIEEPHGAAHSTMDTEDFEQIMVAQRQYQA